MNILFYIEPLIQYDNPVLQEPWLYIHIKNIIEALKDEEFNFYIASNSALSEKIEKIEYRKYLKEVFSFEQSELKVFSSSTLDILRKWYEKSFNQEDMSTYKNLMLKKFKGNTFDIIITFSPVEYLKEIYPSVLFLHYEYGMFSRKPYPRTYYLDPINSNGYSYLDKYYSKIKNIDFKEKDKFLDFLKKLSNVILKDNPFEDEIKKLKKEYKYLILLPLQASNYWIFDFETEYKSQFEYLEDVLIKTLKFKNIGVIVTQHSSNVFLNNEKTVKYLKEKYSNFILLETTKHYFEVSPLIVPYVDAVITISTSVGFHALLWGKKIITLGKSYLKRLSDTNNLNNLDKVLELDTKDRKKILYWLLTRYYIPEDYIKNSKWISNFLERSIEKKDDLENFYDQIDNSKVLFNKFIEQCSLISDTISGQYLQIYVNYGNGYFEENSYKFLYGDEIKLNLSGRYVEYILLKFREIDSVFIEKSYYINKNNEIEELMKSDSPNSYRNFQNMLLIDELKFMEYKINNEVMEVNICIRDYKVLGKNELFEKLYNLEKKLVILDKRNNQLIGEKEELVKQNSVLIKENKDLIDEKNRTLKARILRKISLIKSKIK
jgi:hypothetical protein